MYLSKKLSNIFLALLSFYFSENIYPMAIPVAAIAVKATQVAPVVLKAAQIVSIVRKLIKLGRGKQASHLLNQRKQDGTLKISLELCVELGLLAADVTDFGYVEALKKLVEKFPRNNFLSLELAKQDSENDKLLTNVAFRAEYAVVCQKALHQIFLVINNQSTAEQRLVALNKMNKFQMRGAFGKLYHALTQDFNRIFLTADNQFNIEASINYSNLLDFFQSISTSDEQFQAYIRLIQKACVDFDYNKVIDAESTTDLCNKISSIFENPNEIILDGLYLERRCLVSYENCGDNITVEFSSPSLSFCGIDSTSLACCAAPTAQNIMQDAGSSSSSFARSYGSVPSMILAPKEESKFFFNTREHINPFKNYLDLEKIAANGLTSIQKAADELTADNQPIFYAKDALGNIIRDEFGQKMYDISHPGNVALIARLAEQSPGKFLSVVTMIPHLTLRSDVRKQILLLSEKIRKYDRSLIDKLSVGERNAVSQMANTIFPHHQVVSNLLASCGLKEKDMLKQYSTIEQQINSMAIDTTFSSIASNKFLNHQQITALTSMAATAYNLNDSKKVQEAHSALKIMDGLWRFSKGAVYGATVGQVEGIAHSVRHPIDTAANILTLGFQVCSLCFDTYMFTFSPSRWKNFEEDDLYTNVSLGLSLLKESSAESWGSTIGSLVGLGASGAAIKNFGKWGKTVSEIIESNKRVQQLLENAKHFTPDLATALVGAGLMPETAVYLVAAENLGKTVKTGQRLKQYVNEFTHYAIKHKLALPVDLLISREKMARRIEACCFAYKNPINIVNFLTDVRDASQIFKKANLFLPALPGCTDKALKLIWDVDHIFLPDLKIFKKTGDLASLKGLHLDFGGQIKALGKIEKNGRMIIEETGKIANGAKEVIIHYQGKRYPNKTLFPGNWTVNECTQNIIEAAKNIISSKIGESSKLLIDGATKDNFVIRFIIDPINGKVETCYPNISKMLKVVNE